jgi:hypothetical protein
LVHNNSPIGINEGTTQAPKTPPGGRGPPLTGRSAGPVCHRGSRGSGLHMRMGAGGLFLEGACAGARVKSPKKKSLAEIAAGVLGTAATWVASTGSRAAGTEAQTPRLV